MDISVILAHPRETSFNHAIAKTVVRALSALGHHVNFHDLYAEKFDPILPFEEIAEEAPLPKDVELHCREIAKAEGIVVVHPNWWGQPPAILKGWIDRVIRPGVAYRFLEGDSGDGVPEGLLRAKAAIVLNTSNTPDHREMELFGDPLETLWKNCVFGLCGVTDYYRETFNVMVNSSPEERKEWLDSVRPIIRRYFPA